MKLNFFRRQIKNEAEQENNTEEQVEDVLLKAIMSGEEITRKEALMIPAVSSAVGLICDAFAMIPFRLYEKKIVDNKKQTHEIQDKRFSIINKDTGDTLDGFQFKKAICEDYLMGKGGYAFIKKERNQFKALYYVEDKNVTVNINTDPIFKKYDLMVNEKNYSPYNFIKLLRNSKDGASGNRIYY